MVFLMIAEPHLLNFVPDRKVSLIQVSVLYIFKLRNL